jgi:hypothetical protein
MITFYLKQNTKALIKAKHTHSELQSQIYVNL